MVGSLVIFKLETTEVSKLTFENLLNKYLTGVLPQRSLRSPQFKRP